MTRPKIKRKRRHRPKFKKFYEYTMQDEPLLNQVRLLHKTHKEIAEELFGKMPNYNFGEWQIKADKIILYIDPEIGFQAEIEGTSKLPLSKRLTIHIGLLKLLKRGCCIVKAVNLCLSTLMTQSKNLTSLKN